jgi:hypothetical protein
MVVLLVAGALLVFLIIWFEERRVVRGRPERPVLVVLQLLIPTIVCFFLAVWILLIGPAMVIISGR